MDLKKLEVLLRAADNGYVDLCFFSLIRSGRSRQDLCANLFAGSG